MTRQQAILIQVLTRTGDTDAAVDCTAVYFAGSYGAEYAAARYTDAQLVDRVLSDVAQVANLRA